MQSSNLFHKRCVVSLGRLLRSIVHFPMFMFFEQTTTSSSWSSSKRCRSNCSSHFARGEVLLLYFSFPSLKAGKSGIISRVDSERLIIFSSPKFHKGLLVGVNCRQTFRLDQQNCHHRAPYLRLQSLWRLCKLRVPLEVLKVEWIVTLDARGDREIRKCFL